MQLAVLEARVDELVSDLAAYSGHRTLWLDPGGDIVHGEPEDELEAHGFSYIATLFQPNRDELSAALLKRVSVELDEPLREALRTWEAPAVAVPAMAV
jgi:hypothetical protein